MRRKLSEDDVRLIRSRATKGEALSSIARDHGVSWTAIKYIVTRRNWSHVL
jgi:transposase-like protein